MIVKDRMGKRSYGETSVNNKSLHPFCHPHKTNKSSFCKFRTLHISVNDLHHRVLLIYHIYHIANVLPSVQMTAYQGTTKVAIPNLGELLADK